MHEENVYDFPLPQQNQTPAVGETPRFAEMVDVGQINEVNNEVSVSHELAVQAGKISLNVTVLRNERLASQREAA